MQEFHAFPVCGVADRADDAEAFLLVNALDRARLHHRGHAVGPLDFFFLENIEHVDVDEVAAQFLAGDAVLLHRLLHRLGEFPHLRRCRRAGGALDPSKGVTHVFLRNPRRVALDLHADVALLEQNRTAIAAQHGVAQPRLEPAPSRRQRGGDVAHVLVVHAQKRAELVLLHHRPRALDAVLAQALPVDALLPVHPGNAEIRRAHGRLPYPRSAIRPTRPKKPDGARCPRPGRGDFRNDLKPQWHC
jgi:hypothetical protein